MKISEVPADTALFVCNHIFERKAGPTLLATEKTGELIATCGCKVVEAHMIGFGHFAASFKAISDRNVPNPGNHLMLMNGKWVQGAID